MTTKLDRLVEWHGLGFDQADAAFAALLDECLPHLLAIARFYASERGDDGWPTMAMAAHDAFEALLEPVE